MVFVINPAQIDAVLEICEKYELPAGVIGEVTDTKLMVVEEEGEIIADLPANLLADPPTVEREAIEPVKDQEYVEVEHPSAEEALLKLLSSQNMASKRWVYRQYDHEVQIRTMVKPGDDAAVLRVDDEKAVALTADCNSIHTKLDPYHGGAGSVAEAIRNVVSMGAKPLCVVDCLNFGNPEKPEVFWQFKECVKGMSDIAGKFKTPVISGNVSFYNETEGVTVNPSPVVGVVGVADIGHVRTMDFKKEGDKILVIGWTYNELDGSEYHRTVHGLVQGSAPQIRIDEEIKSAHSILELVKDDSQGNITAIHDCSAGGIGIALSEMAIKSGMGAVVDLSLAPREDSTEFETMLSESHARYIVTVDSDAIDEVLENINAPCSVIGEVKGTRLVMDELLDIEVKKLQKAYAGVIEKFMA
jgi:phosphoribosylformylglycinamidine synthase